MLSVHTLDCTQETAGGSRARWWWRGGGAYVSQEAGGKPQAWGGGVSDARAGNAASGTARHPGLQHRSTGAPWCGRRACYKALGLAWKWSELMRPAFQPCSKPGGGGGDGRAERPRGGGMHTRGAPSSVLSTATATQPSGARPASPPGTPWLCLQPPNNQQGHARARMQQGRATRTNALSSAHLFCPVTANAATRAPICIHTRLY